MGRRDESCPEFVIDEIHKSQLSPNMPCFELSETATIGSLAEAQGFI
jgi:EAL domain-containing protein (putative c-di-GMP-specific phosphodiesterase class I)